MTFELCAETVAACLAAGPGGADRIELCSSLIEDGLSPSYGMIRQAVERSGLPVHVMLRPRAGDFVYSDEEMDVMRYDLAVARELGAAGVVLGVLRRDGQIDGERTAALVALAGPLEVTFHRAIDQVPELPQALEQVIAAGCRRVLTAGGAADAMRGAAMIHRLVVQAGDRIAIAVGGGLRANNAAEIRRLTGASHFHGSARSVGPVAMRGASPAVSAPQDAGVPQTRYVAEMERVRSLVTALNPP